MNVLQAINYAEQQLAGHSNNEPGLLESARIDANYLISCLLDKNFTWLKTWPEHPLSAAQENAYKQMIERRKKGEPIAYITGEKGFWSLELNTNSSTLIPRADTELLVELALEYLAPLETARVLDLGTGTGAIALSIASERKNDLVIATDFNSEAVALAKSNAKRNNITNIEIFHSDWFQSDWFKQNKSQQFDLIVSNPPYIEENDPHLTQGDLVFEPASALIAEDFGLADIKKISLTAKEFLKPQAAIMFEHGYQQGPAVRQILIDNGYKNVKTMQDLAQLDRVTSGIWRGE